MKLVPKPLLWYLIIVTIIALMITWAAFLTNPVPSINEHQSAMTFIIFLGLALSVCLFPIHYNGRIVMFLSTAIDIAAIWILNPVEIIIIIICSVLITPQARTNWRKALFNTCYQIIVLGGIAITSSLITQKSNILTTYQLVLVIFYGIYYIITTTILVGTAVTLSDPSGYNFSKWIKNTVNVFTYVDVTLFLYGFVLSILWFISPQAFILGLILLTTMYWSLKSNADLRKAAAQQQQFQHALANMLSIRDSTQQLKLLLVMGHVFN